MMQLNLNIFAEQLRAKIFSDVTTLQHIDKLKDDSNFPSDASIESGIIQFKFTQPPFEYLIHREKSKFFKSIMGALQDYIDQLIAAVELSKNEFSTEGISSEEELISRINQLYADKLMEVSTNRSLSVPAKLKYLLLPDVNEPVENNVKILESTQSLFDIRNGIEHHKGIASVDRRMHFRRIAIVTTSGQEVKAPGPTGPGEGINMTLINEEINFDQGDLLLISLEQLNHITLNILIYIIVVLKNEADKLINNK
jgi:hypothetical protein